jgi:hypothetical protein
MSIKQYLPSKHFVKFFSITILVGFLAFLLLKFIDRKTEVSQDIQNIATREIIEELDTDNDGVKDWEEALWGLDLDNPDSDEDGILDGQEIEMRRQELKSIDEFVDVDLEPKTETERLARQLLTVALNVNQATGGEISEEELSSVVSGFVNTLEPNLVEMYSISDLSISPTKTAQSYYNEMKESIGYLGDFGQQELVIFEHAISTDKKEKLEDLEPIIVAYAEAPKKVLDKEIPTGVAEYHLDYLNALTQKAVALFSLAQYFDDPIIAVRGIKEYVVAEQNLTEASNNITRYLTNSGIVR